MIGKGKRQPRSSPEITSPETGQLSVLDNPFAVIAAVDLGKENQKNN